MRVITGAQWEALDRMAEQEDEQWEALDVLAEREGKQYPEKA